MRIRNKRSELMKELKMKKIEKKINTKYIIIGLIAYGLLCLVIAIGDGKAEDRKIFLLLGLLCVSAGIITYLVVRKNEQNSKTQKYNDLFYACLKENNGRVTVFQVAIYCGIEPNEARKLIEEKAIQLTVQQDIEDDGTIYYLFK